MGLATFVAIDHQPRLLQHAEMLGYGRLRHTGLCRHYGDRLLAVAAQPLEDGAPRWVGEGSEKNVMRCLH
ncbi:hypothetical protein D3C87_1912980 [compost metagenome]